MPELVGYSPKQNLKTISDFVFARVKGNEKDEEIQRLIRTYKGEIDKTGSLEVLGNLSKFPELDGDKLIRAQRQEFKTGEAKKYKRIIQLTSGIVAGKINVPDEKPKKRVKRK